MRFAAEFATRCRKGALSGPGFRGFMLRGCSKRPCTISGRDRVERGKRLHGSAGASHSRDRDRLSEAT